MGSLLYHLTNEERKVCVWMGVEGSRRGRLLFYTTTSYSPSEKAHVS